MLWVARGNRSRRALALTFDDGPSESTPLVLDLLARHAARATFFQCGANVRRLPHVARAVAAAGHEAGNHTDSHPLLLFRGRAFVRQELRRAQDAIGEATGCRPALFRPPYGAFGFSLPPVLRELRLQNVLWSTIANDWTLPAPGILGRLRRGATPGAILCLHDGRATRPNPDISAMLEALAAALIEWRGAGFELLTLSELLRAPDAH